MFSAYDNALRVLSLALSDALEKALVAAAGPLTTADSLALLERLADNMMKAFELGERDHSALKHAALRGILASPANSGGELMAAGDGSAKLH